MYNMIEEIRDYILSTKILSKKYTNKIFLKVDKYFIAKIVLY